MAQTATSRNVTDRAHRYRANATPPPGEKRCAFCGGKTNVEVGHVNGREEDGDQRNLIWTCRSCNVKAANALRKAGLGRLTKQYNPADKGAQSSAQWGLAVLSMKGEADPEKAMSVKDAVAMIHATSARQRSFYASQLRNIRTQRDRAYKEGNPKAKKNLFGFGKSKEKTGGLFAKKTTSSSKLSTQAYNLGYHGKDFDSWVSAKRGLAPSFVDRLRAQHDKGYDAKHKDEARKHDAKERSDERKEEIQKRREELEIRKLRYQQETPPPLPGAHTFPGSRYGKGPKVSTTKAGKRKLTQRQRLSGTSRSTKRLPKDQAKTIFGGMFNPKNPHWSLNQGNAKAVVYELKTGTHEADIIRPGQPMESETFNGKHSFRSATSWARLRLHEVANPKGCKIKIFKRGTAVKNPIDKAQKMYEEFHGLPSKEVIEYQEQEHRHSVVMGIGPLISLKVVNVQGSKTVELFAPDPVESKLGDVVMLTASEDGRQFIVVGGNQKLQLGALENFGITESDVRDHMLIGTITQLTYRTRKSFEKHGKEEVDFYHDLGKEGSKGICPVLIYKPRNPSMEIAGGRYQIAKPEESLGNVSPGIVG